MNRNYSRADNLIHQFDTVMRTLIPGTARSSRPSPVTADIQDEPMTDEERRHAAGLMRVNHTGEVCAQALYQGQGFTARLPAVREQMEQSAQEEIDHLAWCDERLKELDSHPSVLNPLFYAASFGMGAVAGRSATASAWASSPPPRSRSGDTWRITWSGCRPVTTARGRCCAKWPSTRRTMPSSPWRREGLAFRRR